jgi:hypothetical protein
MAASDLCALVGKSAAATGGLPRDLAWLDTFIHAHAAQTEQRPADAVRRMMRKIRWIVIVVMIMLIMMRRRRRRRRREGL